MTADPGQLDQLAAVLAGLAVILVAGGLALRIERGRLEARLKGFIHPRLAPPETVAAGTLVRPASRKRRSLIPNWARLGASAADLGQAGLTLSPRKFLALQVMSGLAGIWMGRLGAANFGLEGVEQVLMVGGATAVGLWLPRGLLSLKRSQRMSRFESLFPNAIEALANALQAGLSLPQSLELVARDMPKPVGPEFNRVVREMAMGLGLGEALYGLHERIPLNDVEIFVTAVHVQYRTGGNLSDILRSLAYTIRERLRIRGEIKALTAMQRISAIIVSVLPVGIAVAIKFLNPAYFDRLLQPGMMRILLIVAATGIVTGFYAMLRIADIEV
jgi:tight adherence protein B